MATPVALRVVEANFISYRRVWKGSAVTSFVNPILYLAAMGLGLGSLVDDTAAATTLGADSYLEFLAPGMLVATTMITATFESSWPMLAAIKWTKTYEATLATPVGVSGLIGGHFIWIAMRLLAVSTVFVVVMLAFGAASAGDAIVLLIPAVLVGLAIAGPVSAFTAGRESEQGIVLLFRFGITPMFLFSGTFFPISQLPDLIQPLAYLTPLWHGVEVARRMAIGTATTLPIWQHLGYLIVLFAVGAWLTGRYLARRILP
ncbi:MAG TPA: ABC transporter [Actinobacteria bacterium]|nr:ABC transporter [Actinomycetota bacterium]